MSNHAPTTASPALTENSSQIRERPEMRTGTGLALLLRFSTVIPQSLLLALYTLLFLSRLSVSPAEGKESTALDAPSVTVPSVLAVHVFLEPGFELSQLVLG